jgi:hypothetical protein
MKIITMTEGDTYMCQLPEHDIKFTSPVSKGMPGVMSKAKTLIDKKDEKKSSKKK